MWFALVAVGSKVIGCKSVILRGEAENGFVLLSREWEIGRAAYVFGLLTMLALGL
jgi:hypothetical protein